MSTRSGEVHAAYLGVRQQWADGKVQRIENCLGSFVAGLHNASNVEKQWRLRKVQQERKWAEAKRRREEMQRLVRIEEKKAEKLSNDVSNWTQANRIRAYLDHIGNIELEIEGLEEWIKWAKAYADKVDPLKRSEDLVFKSPGST